MVEAKTNLLYNLKKKKKKKKKNEYLYGSAIIHSGYVSSSSQSTPLRNQKKKKKWSRWRQHACCPQPVSIHVHICSPEATGFSSSSLDVRDYLGPVRPSRTSEYIFNI